MSNADRMQRRVAENVARARKASQAAQYFSQERDLYMAAAMILNGGPLLFSTAVLREAKAAMERVRYEAIEIPPTMGRLPLWRRLLRRLSGIPEPPRYGQKAMLVRLAAPGEPQPEPEGEDSSPTGAEGSAEMAAGPDEAPPLPPPDRIGNSEPTPQAS